MTSSAKSNCEPFRMSKLVQTISSPATTLRSDIPLESGPQHSRRTHGLLRDAPRCLLVSVLAGAADGVHIEDAGN